MIYIFVFILFLFLINYLKINNYQGYLNYEPTSFKGVDQNCPKEHARNYYKLVSKGKLNKFFGKYSGEFSNPETDGRLDEVFTDMATGSARSKFQKNHDLNIEYINPDINPDINPGDASITQEGIQSPPQLLQPFGYTKNHIFDITRFVKTDIPLPTDADFFKHI